MTEPLYFGDQHSCFGHYTAAAGPNCGQAVLIVPSIFGEAIRSHWLNRELAKALAAEGYDVLRFDFAGDGNSCSSTQQLAVNDWLRNIQQAYEELQLRSAGASISVFATRFGAGLSLAALAHRAVDRFVFWDPVINGAVMYKSFLGGNSEAPADDHRDNYFIRSALPGGFFQLGLGEAFARGFQSLPEVALPAATIQVIRTETSCPGDTLPASSCIKEVAQKCHWSLTDLPVIFSPKLLASARECF